MKLLIVMLLFCQSLYSQFHIGKTKSEIKEYIRANGYEYKEGTTEEKVDFIIWEIKDSVKFSVTFFGGIDKCRVYYIYPLYNGAKSAIIEYFNNDFVKVSDTEWKAYLNGDIYKIILYLRKNELDFFSVQKQKK